MPTSRPKRSIFRLLLLNANVILLLAIIAIALTSFFRPVRFSWRLGPQEWHAVQCTTGRVVVYITTISNHFHEVPEEIDRFAFAYLDSMPRTGNFGFGKKKGHSGSSISEMGLLGGDLRTDITALIASAPNTEHFRAQLGRLFLVRGWTWVMFPIWIVMFPVLIVPLLALIAGPWRRWRRRRGNNCIHCGYSMQALPTNRCPECGHYAESTNEELKST
jgi:hypothetical protein